MLFLYLSTVNIHGGTLFLGGLDSLVDKVVLYYLESSEFEFLSKRVFPHRSKEFLSLLHNGYLVLFGAKQPECGADHSPSSEVGVENTSEQ